jgi:hypothetical protein
VSCLMHSAHFIIRFHSLFPYAGGTKTTRSPLRLLQGVALLHLGAGEDLAHKLGDPVSLLHLELRLGMVEHDHTQVAREILVHDPATNVDEVFGGQSGPGSHATVGPRGRPDLEVGLGDDLVLRGDGVVVRAAQVVASGELRT